MGAYKRLNKQDAYITTRTAHKTWVVSGSDYIANGIVTHSIVGNYVNSLQQLYYPSKSIDGNVVSHSFDYYNQSTLYNSASRTFSTSSTIYSIPRDLYGVNINPGGSFKLSLEVSPSVYSEITDDGEGNLYIDNGYPDPRYYIGDIMYSHGIVVISELQSWENYVLEGYWEPDYTGDTPLNVLSETLTWQTSHPIFTHTYHCRIRESEFNHTYNPSALSSSIKTTYDNTGDIYSISASNSNGDKNANITGSEFQPYITTVGLYNDANQLIAVGKLGQPIPKSANTEMTITVKIDI
jgi:hypothetical protein